MKKLVIAALLLGATVALAAPPPFNLRQRADQAAVTVKVGPHLQLLGTFPVTVVVEFRTFDSNGANKVSIAAEQMVTAMSWMDIEVVSVLPRVALITVKVSSPQEMYGLLLYPETISVRPDNDLKLDAIDAEASAG